MSQYLKPSSYTPTASQSTFFSSTPRPLTSRTNLQPLSSPLISPTSHINKENRLREVHQKYEKQAQSVTKNYIQHFQEHLSLGSSALELQELLDMEKKRNQALEARVEECFRGMEQQNREKLELARENKELREEVRRKDVTLSDYTQKVTHIQHNANSVGFENDGLRGEVKRLSEVYNGKLREIEEKYRKEAKELSEEIERLRSFMKEKDINGEARLREVARELEAKVRSLENQIREKDRVMIEAGAEFRALREYNMKVKMEFEEELKRQVIMVREKEQGRYEGPVKGLENRIKELEMEKEMMKGRIEEVEVEAKGKGVMVKEVKERLEEQILGLKRENIGLKDRISELLSETERLDGEMLGKDAHIARLVRDLESMNNQLMNQKDKFMQELDRLREKNEGDIKRFQEYEKGLRMRIGELERLLKLSEADGGQLRHDVERLKEQITGNLHRTLVQTFAGHGDDNRGTFGKGA